MKNCDPFELAPLFAMLTIPRARVLPLDGGDPAGKPLAHAIVRGEDVIGYVISQIKDAQQPEIETMQGWLAEWGVSSDDMDMGEMEHGGGMMSDEDMAALESASGAEAAPLFLEQMIAHHQGAIEMAETELANGKNADALALAQAVVDTQSAEIETMQDLLGQL